MKESSSSPPLRVNGREHALPVPPTIAALLAELSLDPRAVVVELNGEALLRHEANARTLRPGDRVEILKITAGG